MVLWPHLYNAAWFVLTPLVKLHLQRRIKTGKEDASRLGERFGVSDKPRPVGKLVWLHGASMGESIALLPLVEKFRALPNAPTVMVTTGTVTSANTMKARLPQGAFHQYLPLDRRAWVRRFLNHWQPDLVVWTESDIWPGVLGEVAARKIPAVLLNARLSEKSVRGWQRFGGWVKNILGQFKFIAAQSPKDQKNLRALGVESEILGNLKFVVPELDCDRQQLAALTALIGNRPLWLFTSIHPGEEIFAANAHKELARSYPDILTIIVPRHPQKADMYEANLKTAELSVARRSRSEDVAPETQIYLADTLGELGLFYRLAKIVVMGGSFVPWGGHNPIEPAKLGAANIFGPHMFNFTAITAAFDAQQAVINVADENAIAIAVRALLDHPHEAEELGRRAKNVTLEEAQSADRIWQAIAPIREKALSA